MIVNTHPKYGGYSERAEADPHEIDVDLVSSHPAGAGAFSLDATYQGPGLRIVNDADPSVFADVPERPHAAWLCDLLNLALWQINPRPATVTPSSYQRAAAIGVSLYLKRQKLAALEMTSHDSPEGRSPNAGVSGGAERQYHDELTHAILLLERELSSLESA